MKNQTMQKWSRAENYAGEQFDDYFVLIGQNRDSDVLGQSNFDTALERLGGESETVKVVRSGHWACGWVELILVHESDSKAVEAGNGILASLENYPVLDESDFSDREHEGYCSYADGAKESVALVLVRLLGLPEELAETEEMLNLAYELNMQEQFYAGADSCLYDNEYHVDKMDERDLSRYENALGRCEHQDENEAYHLVRACFGMDVA